MEAGKVTVKIESEGQSKLKADMNDAKQEVQSFGDKVKGMSLAAKAGWAVAGYAVGNFVKESIQSSIQFEQRFSSFTRLVEGDAQKMLDSLNAAAGGTVSNLQLVTQANNAILLGIKQDQLPELLSAAKVLGAAVGRTTEEAFADLTIGIGRQSRMMLDNLGIVVKAEEAYKEYADSVGKSVEALSAQERQLAFNKAVMEGLKDSTGKLQGSLTESAIAIQQAETAWKNFKTEFAEGAPLEMVTKLLQGATAEIKAFTKETEMLKFYTKHPFGDFEAYQREEETKRYRESLMSRPHGLGLGPADMNDPYSIALENAKEVVRVEQEIKDLIEAKDITQIDNMKELAALEQLYNNRKKEGIEIMGQSFLSVLDKIKGKVQEIDEFAKYDTSKGSRGEHDRRRQEQIDAGIITHGPVE